MIPRRACWVSDARQRGYNGVMYKYKRPTYHPDWGRFRNRRGLVTRPAIRKLVERIAAKFQPEKIIVFGSYVYGKPHEWSDVDLLVVMDAWNELSKSSRILNTIDAPFYVDLKVRTPKRLAWRLKEGDWFLREVVEKGKVMYEKPHEAMAAQGRRRPAARHNSAKRKAAPA
jgi:predicted nucleotidyltransferase